MDATKQKKRIGLLFYIFILLVVASLITTYFWITEFSPSGGDIWGHLYKSMFMYDNFSEHNYYPLYSPSWYNGIQLYRYWPPLVYYVMTGFLYLTSGDILHSYYLFVGFVVFASGIPFILIGRKVDKTWLGLILAILWSIMPDNIRIFFYEGNMPRIMTSVLIPYIIYFLWLYMRQRKKSALVGLMIFMCLMTFTHLMITAIVGIGSFLFLAFDWYKNHETRRSIEALVAMVIGIMCAGIWVVPALTGGMMSMGDSSSQTQDLLTVHLTTSLNFISRAIGKAEEYYFGISILLIATLGIFLAKKNRKAGFCFAILVLLGTTPATVSVTKHLPLGEYMWMTRFTALAYGFFLLAFMEWKTLKKKYLWLFISLLMVDSLASVYYLPNYYAQVKEDTVGDTKLLKEYTTNRASIMDISIYGPYPSWELVTGEDSVNYTFGWAWQGAQTANNIMYLNEALEAEQYYYVFDRSIELGDDAILFMKSYIYHKDDLLEAAKACGYELVETTDTGYLFTKNTPNQYGVITKYEGISIGSYSASLCMYYPSFIHGDSIYIDDYDIDELSKYKAVFLSGFEYHNQEDAEKLLKDLSDQGTKVVIDSSHLPENGLKTKTFLGITQNQISFETSLPNLYYNGKSMALGEIPSDYEKWTTGYVNKADNVLGYVLDNGHEIPFLSYNDDHENIYYLGLNLAFFSVCTDNQYVWDILNDCFGIANDQLPVRELVPINIEMDGNTITIDSEKSGVNTTLAYQDNFVTDQSIESVNNLLVINDKHVVMELEYPNFLKALAVSILGIICAVLFFVYVHMYNKKQSLVKQDEVAQSEVAQDEAKQNEVKQSEKA